MLNLLVELQKLHPTKFPKYISNLEIEKFLNDNRNKLDREKYIEIKNFFLKEQKLNRSAFAKWEEENKNILSVEDKLTKSGRNFPLQKEFEESLQLRRYSPRTRKVYMLSVGVTNSYLLNKEKVTVAEANLEQFKKYFLYLTNERKVSVSTVRIARFSIEYYRKKIVEKPIKLDFAYGIKKIEHIPTIFTKEEIRKILSSCHNLKHKMVLSLLYSSGLRLSEVINLKVKDVFTSEGTIKVRMGKGNQDRMTVLSDKLLDDIKVFMEDRKPNEYLFISNQKSDLGKDKPLSARTVEKLFETAIKKSGVKKHGSPHDFRHSFATHLLESGTDIHFIQKLLGHKNLSTTSIYTKLANPKLAGVKSPL